MSCPTDQHFWTCICSGFVGTGTMILSRHPIVDADFFRFSLNGNVHQILYGDGLAGAGVGMARVIIQVNLAISVILHYSTTLIHIFNA